MPDERPISSSRITANDVSRHSFGVVRRGYDPREVRAYLELVGRELHAWEEREQDFRQQIQEAEHRAQNPVLDEATLTTALGQQTAQLLRKAHEEAGRLVSEAEQRATHLLRETHERVTEAAVQAEASSAERIAEAELGAGAVRAQAEQDAEQMMETARHDGEAVVARAREHGRQMVEEAQEARKRVLHDLAQRRRLAHVQIDQLRAARDELAAAIVGVRDKLDGITAGLAGADDDARRAAAQAGQRLAGALHEDGELAESSDLLVHEVLSAPPPEDLEVPPMDEVPLGTSPMRGGTEEGPGGDDAAAADREPEPQAEEPTRPPEAETAEGPMAGSPKEVPSAHPGSTQSGEPLGAEPGPQGAQAQAEHHSEAGVPESQEASIDNASLEDLFARIRASQSEQGGGGRAEATEAEADQAEAAGDGALVARRRELLGPVQSKLVRRIKRSLQDDQNRLLDGLRGQSGAWSSDLLPDEASHRGEFLKAARGLLEEAASAGWRFAAPLGRGDRPAPGPEAFDVEPVAEDLAETVVTLLRRGLPGGEEGPSVDDVDDASDAVGAAFREWRGARVERLVGDYTVQAFGIGVLAAVGGGEVRWVVSGDGPGCADCDDNSLAGSVSAGDDFPTGQPCPPAHAGCRCLVTPA